MYDEKNELIFFYKDKNDVYYYDSNRFFVLDLDNNERKAVPTDGDVFVECSSDGRYLYTCNWDVCREKGDYQEYGIDVYDMGGKLKGKISLGENMEWKYGDQSFCFAYDFEDGTYSVKQFSMEQLPGKNADWKEILTVKGDGDGD